MSILNQAVLNWRHSLRAQHAEIERLFEKNHNTRQLFKRLGTCTDDLLSDVWQQFEIHPDIALIAVGGYGRNELFPYSDIDLLILLPETLTDAQHQRVENFVSTLWDIGLNVGHSVRALKECADEAAQDVTVITNLMEARKICGANTLYLQLEVAVKACINPIEFILKKLKEQTNRHKKFNDSAYSLEPNLKESPGGLRDLNMVLWLAQSQNLGKTWRELASNNIISIKELRQIRRHEFHLQNLRIRLHYLAKRREDRLLFDFQNELAAQFNLVNTKQKRASEQLMQRYYRGVKFISLINEILLKTFQENLTSDSPLQPINDKFSVSNHLLTPNVARVFQRYPSAIFESFLILQQNPTIEGFSAPLIKELQRVKKSINQDFRKQEAHKKLFLNILSQMQGVNHTLRNMNRYGILGQYIPAFGKIIGQMQHDLFHVYTVDEHILNVLANLRRFSKPELAHEFPLCSKLFASFDKPQLLYLAALFHDIAKGRGGDHSDLGTVDAKRFCKLHHLPKEETHLVAWLVQAHLKMSSVAQKSDLSDPEVIQQFASFVKNEHQLTALYLLTVADIRGTSPAVWNAWKARLLESLYFLTLNVLKDPARNLQMQIDARKQEATAKLVGFGINPNSFNTLWAQFGTHYFNRFDSDEIAWQSRLLLPHQNTNTPIVRTRLSPKGDGIQVMIYSKDRHDIFARICQFFDNMHYNIAQAKIFTTQHHYALDSFIVLEQSTKQISYSGLLKHIEEALTKILVANKRLEAPIMGRVNRQVKHMPIKTQVNLYAEPNSPFHHLEIIANDRPGLLAQMAQQLSLLQIELHNAKINTLGNRVEDSFLITAKNGTALSNEATKKLEEVLEKL